MKNKSVILTIGISLFVLIGLIILLRSAVISKSGSCGDNKLECPDGSSVGMSGPKCDFDPCFGAEEYQGKLVLSEGSYFLHMKSAVDGAKEPYIMPLEVPEQIEVQNLLNKQVKVGGVFSWGNIYKVDSMRGVSSFSSSKDQSQDAVSDNYVPVQSDAVAGQDASSKPSRTVLTNKVACLSAKGKWDDKYNECTEISSKQCSAIGGYFNECASACRDVPEGTMCTQQCVPVCEF